MIAINTRAKSPSMLDIDDAAMIKTMDNYERLAFAIILQAVKDYRRAVHNEKMGVVKECERFFTGSWFEALSELPGSLILEKLRQEDGQKPKKPKKQEKKGKRGRPRKKE